MRFPTTLDEQLQKQLLECSGEILTATGNTMCTHDFYEGKMMFYNNDIISRLRPGEFFPRLIKGAQWQYFELFWLRDSKLEKKTENGTLLYKDRKTWKR